MYQCCEIMGRLYLVKKQPNNGTISIVAEFNGAPEIVRSAANDIVGTLNNGVGIPPSFAPAIGPS